MGARVYHGCMPRTSTAIIVIRETPKGDLLLIDANGGEHVASSGPAAWVLLKQILADPNLPNVEQSGGPGMDLEDILTNYVEAQMPEGLEPLARPAISGVVQALMKHMEKRS